LHPSKRQGNTAWTPRSLIRKLCAYSLHSSRRQGNTVRMRSCYGNYVQTKCNRRDSRETPSRHSLNMKMYGAHYGKPITQKTVQTPPREIRDRLVLGRYCEDPLALRLLPVCCGCARVEAYLREEP
jgi:hypothetical protein